MPIRPAPSVSRAAEVLDLLARQPQADLTLSEIARQLSMNKATCQSVLLALTEHGYVVRSTLALGYSLGPALVTLGNAARSRIQIVKAAEPLAQGLSADLGLTCQVTVLAGEDIVVAVSVHARSPFGTLSDAILTVPHRPPLGAPLVAWSDEATVERWLGRADPPLSTDERARYLHVLEVIREQGFSLMILRSDLAETIAELAIDPSSASARRRRDRALAGLGHTEYLAADLDPHQRYPIGQVSAPVFDHDGHPVAFMLLTGFPLQMDMAGVQAIGARLNATVRQLTTAIGGVWPAD